MRAQYDMKVTLGGLSGFQLTILQNAMKITNRKQKERIA